MQITVRPEHRRQGIGRALYVDATARRREAGRTSACGELHLVDDHGPLAFARAMGAESVHQEDHLLVDLPMDEQHVSRLQAQCSTRYEIVTWQGRCRDDLIDAYAAMRTQMNQDVPTGELDYEPVVMTPERTSLHTWTAPDNHAMKATNAAFGYRPVERTHEVQVKD